MKAKVFDQPCLNLGVLVSGVVVHDEVQLPCLLRFAVDHFEKPQPRLMAEELICHRQHFAIEHIQYSK